MPSLIELLFTISLAAICASGFAALVMRHRPAALRVGSAGAITGCIAGLALAAICLASGAPHDLLVAGPVPEHPFSFHFDALSGLFLALVFGVGGLACGYSVSYGVLAPRGLPGLQAFCVAIFIASMAVVVVADDVITFLASWELMTVSAFLLIPYEHEKREVRKAAYLFLVASQIGTAFLLIAFLLLSHHAGSIAFDAFRKAAPMSAGLRSLVFGLAFVGFGTKAGLIPFHVWLPLAHPVAPSHVSAMMSGVMIKTAIYGLIRFAFEFVVPLDAWWGLVLLAAGALSAVLGALFALVEHDLKRVLAYSSIENIGIVTMGLGLAIYFHGRGSAPLASHALLAALLHTFNHALFKSLLFLGAGAALAATGEHSLEHLGGLLRRMPFTGAFVLVGAFAISGLPPLNGFVSEWMIYQGLWAMSNVADGAHLLGPVAAAALALVGGLAAACFSRAYGVAFLGLARTEASSKAAEVGRGMLIPMGVLAGLCILAGLLPGAVLQAMSGCLPFDGKGAAHLFDGLPSVPAARVSESPLLPLTIPVALGFVLLGLHVARRRMGLLPVESREYGPWNCGYPVVSAHAQYSAAGFSQPFAYFARKLFSRRKLLDVHARHHFSPYLPESLVLRVRSKSPFDNLVYHPVQRFVIRLSMMVSRLQTGSLRLYLALVLGTVIVMLLVQP